MNHDVEDVMTLIRNWSALEAESKLALQAVNSDWASKNDVAKMNEAVKKSDAAYAAIKAKIGDLICKGK